MCGCTTPVVPMSAYSGFGGPDFTSFNMSVSQGHSNATGTETTDSKTTSSKVADISKDAAETVKNAKSMWDIFSGKEQAGSSEEEKPAMSNSVYLYAAGGLVLLVAIIYAFKKK